MVTRKLKNPNYNFSLESEIENAGGRNIAVHPSADGSHVLRVFQTREGDIVAFFVDGMEPVNEWVKRYGLSSETFIQHAERFGDGNPETTKISPRPTKERGY
jgi:hypothetical protein